MRPFSTIGSFLVEGLVRSLFNVVNKEHVIQMLTLCEIHIIPMLNPDGVVAGNTKVSLSGLDLSSDINLESTYGFSFPEL